MCEKEQSRRYDPSDNVTQAMPRKPHMVYELEQKRDYHIKQLVDIQKAIDAISMVSSLY